MSRDALEVLIANDDRFSSDIAARTFLEAAAQQPVFELGNVKSAIKLSSPMFLPSSGFSIATGFAKGVVRGGLRVADSIFQNKAEEERLFSNFTERITGERIPIATHQRTAKFTHKKMVEFTTGDAFLAPEIQGESFAWDEPKWWASSAGEAIAFMATVVTPAGVAGNAARAAALAPKIVRAVTYITIQTVLGVFLFMFPLLDMGIAGLGAGIAVPIIALIRHWVYALVLAALVPIGEENPTREQTGTPSTRIHPEHGSFVS